MTPTDAQITRWAHRYRVPVEDAKQERALWELENTPTTHHTLVMRIRKQSPTNNTSLDYRAHDTDRPLEETIPAPLQQIDDTYDKSLQAIAYWLKDGTLNPAQAEAIYWHDIEGRQYKDIAQMHGITANTVCWHRNNGIKRLQERYAHLQGIS